MFVYKITNLVNGKFYIGKTTKTIAERFKQHTQLRSSNMLISHAIKKYGSKNFIIEELATAATELELSNLEKTYITSLSPHYNIAEGGTGGATRRGLKHTAETKQKISLAHKGKTLSDKHKLDIGLKIKKSWLSGVLGSLEVRKKRANSNKKIYTFTTNADDVIVYDLKHFCKEHNLNYICMIAVASGKRSTPYNGYTAAKRRDSD